MVTSAILVVCVLACFLGAHLIKIGPARERARETERDLPHAIALLGSWSSGDPAEASEDRQHLAIETVRSMRRHMNAGTSPLSDTPDLDGSMKSAGSAMGQPLAPASWAAWSSETAANGKPIAPRPALEKDAP